MLSKPRQCVMAVGVLSAAALAGTTAPAVASAPAIASGAGVVSAPGAGSGAAVPGWRIVSTDRRSGIDLQDAVIALGRANAWAAGGVSPTHTTAGRPFAEHWNGHRWGNSKLPAGLSGAIEVLSASAWNNVWAFGATAQGNGGFALRWNGHRWLVMKRWSALTSVSGAVVLSPTNVWTFGAVSGPSPVRHFNGHRWTFVRIDPGLVAIDSVAALPNGDIWALGNGGIVLRGTVTAGAYTWQVTQVPGFGIGNSGDELTDIRARSASDVWALGGNVRTVGGHDHWFPLAAHWDGSAWHPVRLRGAFTLGGGASASDGHGGLWVTTGWDSTGVPPHLLHFAGGTFTRVNLPPRGGRYVGVFGLAAIPGTTAVWGAGALTGSGATGPTTGVILKYGR